MCNVYRETCFSQNTFTNGQNIGLPLRARVKKEVHRVKAHKLSSKQRVPGAVVSKESQAESLLSKKKKKKKKKTNHFP